MPNVASFACQIICQLWLVIQVPHGALNWPYTAANELSSSDLKMSGGIVNEDLSVIV